MSRINYSWITVNRNCNLRCKWCYAKNTNYQLTDDIDYNIACMIMDWLRYLNVNNVIFTGGEPTCYENLFNVIKYADSHSLKAGIVTNGIMLSDRAYCQKLIDSGINNVDISLKGSSPELYYENTGNDVYARVMKAINNLHNTNVDFTVSMVLNGDNISDFISGVRDAGLQGASVFNFSFCKDFSAIDTGEKMDDYNIEHNVFRVIDLFTNQYDKLNELTDGNFVLHQTFPLCLWNKDIINAMLEKNQLATSCQFLRHDGIIFDTKANIIPCNLMYQIKLGEIGKEYTNAESLAEYLNTKKVRDFYNATALTYPDNNCIKCDNWKSCGGGCVSNWLNFSYCELEQSYEKFFGVPLRSSTFAIHKPR